MCYQTSNTLKPALKYFLPDSKVDKFKGKTVVFPSSVKQSNNDSESIPT